MAGRKQTFRVFIALDVRAVSKADAYGTAQAAAEHLLDTFNDDGSVRAAEAVRPLGLPDEV